ncbi:MAG: type II toxin-antitoxin system Phd/YefM family antitoxin [Candidatus Tectomicrobia bacterium]|uniref:Antitoxin n=1 Tax=Tectimicrobiota bacterium TaxID=2528274 RepID=A0A932M0A2_UNCTE|nr:type II toxin-antitoxin system Phd/YefM family antitoxin [Candidatus Tectomicrobia bacterium]
MPLSSKDIIPLTRARAQLTELCEEVRRDHREKIITKNGESCAALIDPERLDHYHRLEREHIHLMLLEEVIHGLEDLKAGKTVSLRKLKARYAR